MKLLFLGAAIALFSTVAAAPTGLLDRVASDTSSTKWLKERASAPIDQVASDTSSTKWLKERTSAPIDQAAGPSGYHA
jgi:hypothetical protein